MKNVIVKLKAAIDENKCKDHTLTLREGSIKHLMTEMARWWCVDYAAMGMKFVQ